MRGLTDFPDVDAAFDRRLTFASRAPLAIALSGGGDSMALLHIAALWAKRRGRRLLALSVDHGLNPESAAWTAFAGDAARRAGADWRALAWLGEKPRAGLPAAARLARHKLLANAARNAGASVVLLAHTADDVAEGEVMRRGDAPTLGRLQDWSPSPVWPEGRDLFLCRPMLGVQRSALRRWLSAQGLAWLDDPANDDPQFARARARRALAATPNYAPEPAPVRPDELSSAARQVKDSGDGRLTAPRFVLASLDPAPLRRMFSIAVTCAAGAPAPPRTDALDRLARRLEAEPSFIATLNGARIETDPNAVRFSREAGDMARACLTSLFIRSGQTQVWDGRFEIVADADLVVQPLAGAAARLSKSDRAALHVIPASVRPSLPALFHGQTVALPRPFGSGPATANTISGRRLAAACGFIAHERDISPPRVGWAMAQGRRSSYVEALALA